MPRFIPAWAGNTITHDTWIIAQPVHPRVGGEHALALLALTVIIGSSPRGRGTPGGKSAQSGNRRFIPAWAGNTTELAHRAAGNAVHPRVGGEHEPSWSARSETGGSSPRGRGTHGPRKPDHGGRRFIPAWAGNTTARSRASFTATVHPRVGGEHEAAGLTAAGCPGSSPRGRGTRFAAGVFRYKQRFIPAWAGNTGRFAIEVI